MIKAQAAILLYLTLNFFFIPGLVLVCFYLSVTFQKKIQSSEPITLIIELRAGQDTLVDVRDTNKH